MSARKLKGQALWAALVVFVAGVVAPLAGSSPTAGREGRAVLPAADEGQIWFKDERGTKLVAIDPTGRELRRVGIPDGRNFRGISPPLNKLWFAGKDGRLPTPGAARPPRGRPGQPPPEEGLTLHVREINGKAEGKDLGVELTRFSILSEDGKTVGRVVWKQVATRRQAPIYENSLVDVATKRVTKLDLPNNHQLIGIAPDRSWVLSLESNFPPAEGVPAYRLYSLALAGGKPRLLSGKLVPEFGDTISPDGKRVLMFALDLDVERSKRDLAAYVVDVGTGKSRRVAGHEKQLWAYGVWSPDGKRIAYAWRARNDDGRPVRSPGVAPTRVVVCDADGKNARTVLTTGEFLMPLGWR